MVIVAIPAEVGVVAVLWDEPLALEVRVVEADPGSALHTDGVHPIQQASVLEVVTIPEDLQRPPCDAFALIQSALERSGWRVQGHRLLSVKFGSRYLGPNTLD